MSRANTSAQVKQLTAYYTEHFSSIVGGTITGMELSVDPDEPGVYWPTLIVKKSGKKFAVLLSQDEEGNGPGYAFIEDES